MSSIDLSSTSTATWSAVSESALSRPLRIAQGSASTPTLVTERREEPLTSDCVVPKARSPVRAGSSKL